MSRLVHIVLVLPLLAGAAGAAGAAGEEREHEHMRREQMREAVERGEIKSLVAVLGAIRGRLPGEIIGVEIERKGHAWVYEFRVSGAEGQLYEVYVDAATAEILKTKEK